MLRIDPTGYKRALRERRASSDPRFASGVWRLLELLPSLPADSVVTLGEGNVPLYDSPRGASYAGVDGLAYLHLGMNPTGSFKDLGMTVAVSAAKAAGARGVACASTGNTASSMAAYAARAGLPAYALIPRGRISKAKLAQILDYGAHIVEVDGSFDDAFAKLASIEGDLAIVNSTNPYRIEGQKCAAFMMLEARGWRVPEWVAVPGGNLGNSTAIGRGFREALALGLIDRLPRLAVVQAAGAAPFARAFETGEDLLPLVPQTRASAIAVGSPKSWRASLHEVRASDGVVLAVDDDAIDDAKGAIGREGIGCEPASAATLAGIRALRRSGVVGANADVVAVLTGHVLKDADASLRIHEGFRSDAHAAV
ncbi:MAG TPA: threonine synthase [Candidatus Acidoferrales bacterium]|jgi:threonine synthase|nr:threonine synthase [Candidatus Acidoferrales bacterium]